MIANGTSYNVQGTLLMREQMWSTIRFTPNLLACARLLSGRALLAMSDLARFARPNFDPCAFLLHESKSPIRGVIRVFADEHSRHDLDSAPPRRRRPYVPFVVFLMDQHLASIVVAYKTGYTHRVSVWKQLFVLRSKVYAVCIPRPPLRPSGPLK